MRELAAILAAAALAAPSRAHETYVNSGLRLGDGKTTVPIAVEPAGALGSPLRIRASDGKLYSVALADPADSDASRLLVMTDQGPRALLRYRTPAAGPLDFRRLPLGDGKYVGSPKVGSILPCNPSRDYFQTIGAHALGPWIHGSTWDTTQKMTVTGSAQWPNASFSIATSGGRRVFTGNDLPPVARTGLYPIQDSDPVYPIDPNPNPVQPQSLSFTTPIDPQLAASPSCVSIAIIGVALDGVPFYSALDVQGHDAPAHEVQDECNGHPNPGGTYHYHSLSPCIPHIGESAALVGYALDGFGIYSPYAQDGRELTTADLDECHGTTSVVPWDGQPRLMYHYVLTRDYPYTIGCFRGTPAALAMPSGSRSGTPPSGPGPGGPAQSNAAATGSLSSISCTEVLGSASDADAPSRPVSILFYLDGPREPSDSSPAGDYLGAVIATPRFSFRLPATVRDGRQHSLYVYAIDIDSSGFATSAYPALSGSPKTLQCP